MTTTIKCFVSLTNGSAVVSLTAGNAGNAGLNLSAPNVIEDMLLIVQDPVNALRIIKGSLSTTSFELQEAWNGTTVTNAQARISTSGAAISGLTQAIRDLITKYAAVPYGDNGLTLADSMMRLVGSADPTKVVKFEVDGLTTETTRTVTVPDADVTIPTQAQMDAKFDKAGGAISGNLGIGVTPSAGTKLEVKHTNGSKGIVIGTSAVAGSIRAVDGFGLKFLAYKLGFQINDTDVDAMTLDASGSLLVGTPSASWSSAGRGLIEVNGGSTALIGLKTGGTQRAYFYHTGGETILNSLTGGITLQATGGTAQLDNGGNWIHQGSSGSALLAAYQRNTASENVFSSTGSSGSPKPFKWSVNAESSIGMTLNTGGNIYVPAVYGYTTANAANMYVFSDGQFARSTSSAKYKKDIETLESEFADKALELRPVWYRSTCEGDNSKFSYYGFIAEEAAKVDPRFVHWKFPTKTVELEPARTETKTVQRQKTVTVQAEQIAVEVIDGQALQVRKVVDIEQPVFDYLPVFDTDGNPVLEVAEPAIEAQAEVLDDEGNVVAPAVAAKPAVYCQALHQVLVLEDVTETVEIPAITSTEIDYSGKPEAEGFQYERIVVPLQAVAKRQQAQLAALESTVQVQAKAIAALIARIEALEARA